MATSKTNEVKIDPIFFDDEPFDVLVNLQSSAGLKSIDDERLGDNFSCFVLKTSEAVGIPSWDKGDPDKGIEPKPDLYTQILFVPTYSVVDNIDNKLYNKVGDRTVCRIFKKGRQLANFKAAGKTTRSGPNAKELNDLVKEINVPELEAWQLVVWTPQFTPKTSKDGHPYSGMKWWWNMPQGPQLETQQRIIQMYKTFGVRPMELDYEVDPGVILLDNLKHEEKREVKKLIAAQSRPALKEVADVLLALGAGVQAEDQSQLARTVEVMPV